MEKNKKMVRFYIYAFYKISSNATFLSVKFNRLSKSWHLMRKIDLLKKILHSLKMPKNAKIILYLLSNLIYGSAFSVAWPERKLLYFTSCILWQKSLNAKIYIFGFVISLYLLHSLTMSSNVKTIFLIF